MNPSSPRSFALTATLLAALTVVSCERGSGPRDSVDDVRLAALRSAVEATPAELTAGKALFEEHCATCHGALAEGSDLGPPLAHDIYEPGHHADAAFLLAVKLGVRAHHWRFGDMPPLPQVSDDMALRIVPYVRWLQRQVGIE